MKWPLLGIVVVMCLQMGFTVFNAIDRPIESLVVIDEPTRGTNPVAVILDDQSSGDIISTTARRIKYRAAQAILIPVKKEAKVSRIVSAPQIAFKQRPIEPTVITYPRVIRARSEYEVSNTVATVARPTEKRSFWAKSVAILKKPYGWVKAVGSRIN